MDHQLLTLHCNLRNPDEQIVIGAGKNDNPLTTGLRVQWLYGYLESRSQSFRECLCLRPDYIYSKDAGTADSEDATRGHFVARDGTVTACMAGSYSCSSGGMGWESLTACSNIMIADKVLPDSIRSV